MNKPFGIYMGPDNEIRIDLGWRNAHPTGDDTIQPGPRARLHMSRKTRTQDDATAWESACLNIHLDSDTVISADNSDTTYWLNFGPVNGDATVFFDSIDQINQAIDVLTNLKEQA